MRHRFFCIAKTAGLILICGWAASNTQTLQAANSNVEKILLGHSILFKGTVGYICKDLETGRMVSWMGPDGDPSAEQKREFESCVAKAALGAGIKAEDITSKTELQTLLHGYITWLTRVLFE